MCMMSQPVTEVSGTRIFGRVDGHEQVLAYAMSIAADVDMAMVLPLPVPPNPREDAVTFVSLERYPSFFAAMEEGFRPPAKRGLAVAVAASATLKVHRVGAFEASFVPRLGDFTRLDPRFRLPDAVWESLPFYGDYGFAVFKLRGAGGGGPHDPKAAPSRFERLSQWIGGSSGAPRKRTAGAAADVHPMAFRFPTRDPENVFFPTVHVHDGAYHPTADFDHFLYVQPSSGDAPRGAASWTASRMPARDFMDVERTGGLVLAEHHCWKDVVQGRQPNRDILVKV